MTPSPAAPGGPALPDVVTARRVEVVDPTGRARVVLGVVDDAAGPPVFGMAVLDGDGRSRTCLALDATGPCLTFTLAGNVTLVVGVNDPEGDAAHVGAYLVLADADGRPALGWRVHDGGNVLPVDTDPPPPP